LHNSEGVAEPIPLLRNQTDNIRRHLRSGRSGEAEEDHTAGTGTVGEDEPSEMPIFRQKNAAFACGQSRDTGIGGARRHPRNRQDIVAGGSKSANDRKVAALIARKRMAGTFHAYAGPPTATVSSHATVSAAKARAARMSSGANRG